MKHTIEWSSQYGWLVVSRLGSLAVRAAQCTSYGAALAVWVQL